jgi:hypothetical protein
LNELALFTELLALPANHASHNDWPSADVDRLASELDGWIRLRASKRGHVIPFAERMLLVSFAFDRLGGYEPTLHMSAPEREALFTVALELHDIVSAWSDRRFKPLGLGGYTPDVSVSAAVTTGGLLLPYHIESDSLDDGTVVPLPRDLACALRAEDLVAVTDEVNRNRRAAYLMRRRRTNVWVRPALSDWAAAGHLLAHPDPSASAACWLSSHCNEKLLKALLAHFGVSDDVIRNKVGHSIGRGISRVDGIRPDLAARLRAVSWVEPNTSHRYSESADRMSLAITAYQQVSLMAEIALPELPEDADRNTAFAWPGVSALWDTIEHFLPGETLRDPTGQNGGTVAAYMGTCGSRSAEPFSVDEVATDVEWARKLTGPVVAFCPNMSELSLRLLSLDNP